MKRVLVTGHAGMLGRNLVGVLSGMPGLDIYGVSRKRLTGISGVHELNADLGNVDSTVKILQDIKPDVIVHTAAITNLQYCESNTTDAYKLHVELSKTLASCPARMIYISTDSVFDGRTGAYRETDPAYPLNYYAFSKFQGEWETLCANKRSLVIRTNIYGFNKPAGNSLAEWAIDNLKEKRVINGFSDVLFNPLYVGQLSNLIAGFLTSDLNGVLHTGCADSMSKFVFLRELAHTFGFAKDLIKESVLEDGVLRRPKNTTLSLQTLQSRMKDLPTLAEGLQMFKSDYRNQI